MDMVFVVFVVLVVLARVHVVSSDVTLSEGYGNCFTGALLLMLVLGSWRLRVVPCWYPHFYVKDADGVRWHFANFWRDRYRKFWYRGYYAEMPAGYLR